MHICFVLYDERGRVSCGDGHGLLSDCCATVNRQAAVELELAYSRPVIDDT